MENYKRFYKKALQYFAVALYVENKRLSEQLFQEESINKLKSFILNKKMQMTEKEFFFLLVLQHYELFKMQLKKDKMLLKFVQ